MSVWRLHVHTREKIGDYCLAHNVIAMGWSFEEFLDASDPKQSELAEKIKGLSNNWEDFLECAEKVEYDFVPLIKLHDEVCPGDSVWMYCNGSYYIARINKNSKWRFCQEAREFCAANQLVNVKWHRVASKNDSIPRTLEAAFSLSEEEFSFKKILDYDVEIFSGWLLTVLERNVASAEPANIWRILQNTSHGNISEYSLDNNIAAMGWSFSGEEIKKIETWEEYEKCSEASYGGVDPSVQRFHGEVIPGDVIWMRSNDRYYYAVVSNNSEWRFNNDSEARDKDASNQLTNIYWREVEDAGLIPEALERQFKFLGPTFRRILKSEIWDLTLKLLGGQIK